MTTKIHVAPVPNAPQSPEMGELHAALAAVDGVVARERARADKLNRDLSAVQGRLERESQHNATRAAELQIEKEELESRLAVHAHQVTALQQKLATLAVETKSLKERLAIAESTGSEERSRLQSSLDGARSLLESARERASGFNHASQELRARLDSVSAEHEALKRSTIEREARYRETFQTYQARDRQLLERDKVFRQTLQKARAEIDRARTETATVRMELEKLRGERAEVERIRDEGRKAHGQAEQLSTIHRDLEQRARTLEEWNRSINDSLAAEKRSRAELARKLEAEGIEREQLRSAVRAAEEKTAQADLRAQRLTQEMAATRLARVRDNPPPVARRSTELDLEALISERPVMGFPVGPESTS